LLNFSLLTNRQVYNLIHQLFLIDEEEVKEEQEEQKNAL
jgi:hypothetical protein